MSNALAVAATTRTLRNLLSAATPNVTTLPLDKARDAAGADQLNLFLYQTTLNAAWRNADPIAQTKPGETGHPPLPLDLHYLVTAFGDDEVRAHEVLGRAISILHDHPLLGSDEIVNATAVDLPDSDLHLQRERIRVTPLTVSTDDMFKLWSGFQTNYRLSAAYEVGVVLVDSTRPTRSPLPVLRQGADDRGPVAVPTSAPVIASAAPADGDPVAVLGGRLLLRGTNLGAPVSKARFSNVRLDDPIELTPEPGTTSERAVILPSGSPAVADWAPGQYTVAVVSSLAGDLTWVSNEAVFGLGATIEVAPLTASPGTVALTVACAPRLRPGQRVLLLFGDRQQPPDTVTTPADPTQPSTLTFTVPNVAAGTYVVRVRVDGVDSNAVMRSGSPPRPAFNPQQQVVVS